MNKKILIGSIIAVAIIVLASFSSVVGKVSSDEELVEFDVEFCGLGKKHTVKLTQQEADGAELLFDDIEQRLSEVETREQAEVIFKDAIVELDKYGLLGGLSVRFVQNLVTGKYRRSSDNEIEKCNPSNDELYNRNCLVLGTSLEHVYFSPPSRIKSISYMIYDFLFDERLMVSFYLFALLLFIILVIINVKPLHFNCDVAFGILSVIPPIFYNIYPASGTIYTVGGEGVKSLYGEFFGHLNHNAFRTGMIGFTGLKILNNFIGFAKEVELRLYTQL